MNNYQFTITLIRRGSSERPTKSVRIKATSLGGAYSQVTQRGREFKKAPTDHVVIDRVL